MGGSAGGASGIGSPYGGGGGNRFWEKEQPSIQKGYDFQFKNLGDFVANNPLLNAAQTGALSFWDQLPQMLGQFKGFGNEISGYQDQLGNFSSQLGGISNRLGGFSNTLGTLANRTGALSRPFSKFLAPGSALNEFYRESVAPTLRNQGALSPEALRNATQLSRSLGPSGTNQDPAAIARDVLSREDFRQKNEERALGLSQGVLGQQGGATGILQGLLGQQANITGQRAGIAGQQAGILGQRGAMAQAGAGLTGQKANLLQQEQGMQTSGLNQLLGVGNAAVSQFSGLTNPILSYLSNLFSGNQQSQIAQAQIASGAAAADDKKGLDAIGAAGSVVGNIIGGIAMSDERLKTKIRGTGMTTPEGIPLKIYEFKTRPGVSFVGPMAQDVQKVRPDAVLTDPVSGVKMVNFWQLAQRKVA